jgi:hypothetical protein
MEAENPYRRESLSTLYLLVVTSLDHLHFLLTILFVSFNKTSYLNKEANCTEHFPLVSVPWCKDVNYIRKKFCSTNSCGL